MQLTAYKIQLVQKLHPNDNCRRIKFANAMLSHIDDINGFHNHIVFSDATTFSLCDKVHWHNCKAWGDEKPLVLLGYEHNSPIVNLRCALTWDSVIRPLFSLKVHFQEHYEGKVKSSWPSLHETRDTRQLDRNPDRSWCHHHTTSMVELFGRSSWLHGHRW